MILPIAVYVAVCFTIYALGIYILITKRNILRMILAIELMLTAANVSFVIFSVWLNNGYVDPLVRSIVIISMALGSLVAALAIALVIMAFRLFGTRDIRKLSKLRW